MRVSPNTGWCLLLLVHGILATFWYDDHAINPKGLDGVLDRVPSIAQLNSRSAIGAQVAGSASSTDSGNLVKRASAGSQSPARINPAIPRATASPAVHSSKISSQNILTFGTIYPFYPTSPYNNSDPTVLSTGLQWSNAINMAIDEINSRNDLLPGILIKYNEYSSFDQQGSQGGQAVLAAVQAVITDSIHAVIGDWSNDPTSYEALLAGRFNKPYCAPVADSNTLSTKSTYTSFFRMLPQQSEKGKLIADFVKSMGWQKAFIIATATTYDDYGATYVSDLITRFNQTNLPVPSSTFFMEKGNSSDLSVQLNAIQASYCRVIIVCAAIFPASVLYAAAMQAGLTGPQYVWITTDGIYNAAQYQLYIPSNQMPTSLQSVPTSDSSINAHFRLDGPINLIPSNPLFNSFLTRWNTRTNIPLDVHNVAVPAYDCVYGLAYGFQSLINTTLNGNASSFFVGADPMDNVISVNTTIIFNTSFPSLKGAFTFDVNGNLVSNQVNIINRFQGVDTVITQLSVPSNNPLAANNSPIIATIAPAQFSQSGSLTATATVPADFPPNLPINETWVSGVWAPILAVIGILMSLITAVLFWVYRTRPVIKATSPLFCVYLLAGIALGNATIFLYIGIPTNSLCRAQPFVVTTAFGLVFANLLAKTYRIYRIFNNPKLQNITISDLQLTGIVGSIVFVELIICTIWVIVGPPVATSITLSPVSQYWTCMSVDPNINTIFVAVLLAFNGVLLCVTTYLSVLTRNVMSAYNESKFIGLCVYNVFALSALFLPLIYADILIPSHFILRSVGTLLATYTTLGLLFAPKLYVLFVNMKPGVDGSTLGASSTGKKGQLSSKASTNSEHAAKDVMVTRFPKIPMLKIVPNWFLSLFSKWEEVDIALIPNNVVLILQTGKKSSIINLQNSKSKLIADTDEGYILELTVKSGESFKFELKNVSQATAWKEFCKTADNAVVIGELDAKDASTAAL